MRSALTSFTHSIQRRKEKTYRAITPLTYMFVFICMLAYHTDMFCIWKQCACINICIVCGIPYICVYIHVHINVVYAHSTYKTKHICIYENVCIVFGAHTSRLMYEPHTHTTPPLKYTKIQHQLTNQPTIRIRMCKYTSFIWCETCTYTDWYMYVEYNSVCTHIYRECYKSSTLITNTQTCVWVRGRHWGQNTEEQHIEVCRHINMVCVCVSVYSVCCV